MPKLNVVAAPFPRGIDVTAPGGISQLLDFHRQTFGDAVMEDNSNGGTGGNSAGGSGTGGDGQQSTSTEQGGNGGDGGQQKTGGTGTQQEQPKPGDGKQSTQQDNGNDDLSNISQADLARMVRDLRKQNGDSRIDAKKTAADEARTELTQSLGRALGLVKDENDKPDAEALTKQLTERDTAAKQAQTELAVYKTAGKHGADADALLDSRAFLAKIADLDPTKTADIETAIKDAVKENPKLSAARAAGKSSAEFNGGSGEGANRPKNIREALSRASN